MFKAVRHQKAGADSFGADFWTSLTTPTLSPAGGALPSSTNHHNPLCFFKKPSGREITHFDLPNKIGRGRELRSSATRCSEALLPTGGTRGSETCSNLPKVTHPCCSSCHLPGPRRPFKSSFLGLESTPGRGGDLSSLFSHSLWDSPMECGLCSWRGCVLMDPQH